MLKPILTNFVFTHLLIFDVKIGHLKWMKNNFTFLQWSSLKIKMSRPGNSAWICFPLVCSFSSPFLTFLLSISLFSNWFLLHNICCSILSNMNDRCQIGRSKEIFFCSQFHQHFTRAFFVRKRITQLYLVTFQLCNFWRQYFIQKIRT